MITGEADIDLRLGDWRDALANVEQVDAVICDPPYGSRTHAGQTHDRKNPAYCADRCLTSTGINYTHLGPDDVAEFLERWGSVCRGWLCVFSCSDLAGHWRSGFESIKRTAFAPLACVQKGSNVRLAGDGPSNWTTWLNVARPKRLSKWGTLPGAYVVGQDQQRKRGFGVIGGKPIDLMRAIVRDYSRPGDLVCDPFTGGGTTARACALEGRRFVGSEVDPETYKIAQARVDGVGFERAGQSELFAGSK